MSRNVLTDLPHPPRGGRPSSRDGGRPPRPNGRGPLWGLVAAVIVVGLLATVLVRLASQRSSLNSHGPQPTATSVPTASPTPASHVVSVYFSKRPDSLNDPTAVFPVQRTTSSSDVGTFAIQQLIAGPTAAEAAQGYFTEVTAALSGPSDCGGADFTLTMNTRGSTPQTGTTTLRFCRSLQLPGEMTDPRIQTEITKTLTQFPGISSVVILTREGHCLGDLSGGDGCLH